MHQQPTLFNGSAYKTHPRHEGHEFITVDGHKLYLGAARDIQELPEDVNVVVSLNGDLVNLKYFGVRFEIIHAELQDYGGVPDCWSDFIHNIADEIKRGVVFLAHCMGGHGRTGVFAASLVAVMDPSIEDPIEYVRENYCQKAVESALQMKAVFDLARKPVPEKYMIGTKTVVHPGPVTAFPVGDYDSWFKDWEQRNIPTSTAPVQTQVLQSNHYDHLADDSAVQALKSLYNEALAKAIMTGDFTEFDALDKRLSSTKQTEDDFDFRSHFGI